MPSLYTLATRMRRLGFGAVLVFGITICVGCRLPGSDEGEQVVIYSPFPESTARELKRVFEAETGIKVVQVRDGTTRIHGRLRAERDKPKADVWYGGGGIVPFIAASEDGLLARYVPTGYENLSETRGNLILRDREFQWTGMCIIALGFAYNPQLLSPEEIPKTWEELAEPRFRNKIEMWDPGVSGTAMLFLGSALQRAKNKEGGDEEKGWDFLKAYWQNLKGYTVEGMPAFNVARGSVGIGIHLEHQVLEFIEEQTGGDLGGGTENISWYLPPNSPVSVDPIALIKNGPNPENAKKYIDFVLSDAGQEIINRYFFSMDPERPGPGGMEEWSMDVLKSRAQKLDTRWMAENNDRIRKRWQNEIEQIPRN